jgi:hypothetical protein
VRRAPFRAVFDGRPRRPIIGLGIDFTEREWGATSLITVDQVTRTV